MNHPAAAITSPPSTAAAGPSITQRIAMFHDTTLPLQTALALEPGQFTFDLLKRHGCTYRRLRATDVRFESLARAGFTTAEHWRDVGMDAIDLRDVVVARSMVSLYGVPAVKACFLQTAHDAVALVGTDAADLLDVTLNDLLALCAGEPLAAHSVLSATRGVAQALDRPALNSLLDAGLRAQGLAAAGISLVTLMPLKPSADELSQLGYYVDLGS